MARSQGARLGGLAVPARFIFGHRDILGLLGCNVLLGMAFSFVLPFMSLFGEHEVGMSPRGFGLFMTLTSLSGILASTILARWSDTRLSRRAVLLLGSASGAMGYVGYAFVRDPVWLAVIGSVLIGISTITFSQLFAHARELLARSDADPKDVPLYMNVFRLFFALAWTIGPAVASLVMAKYSYTGTYLVAASCFATLFVAVLRFNATSGVETRGIVLHADTAKSETTGGVEARALAGPRQVPLAETIRALARGEVAAHFVGFVLVFACGSLGSISLPLLIVETLKGTTRNVGIVYSVSPFFELPLMLFFGVLASRGAGRGDHARLIRTGVLLAIAYYVLLALAKAPWQVYPMQVISAAITAVIQGVAITFFQDFLPDQVGTATNLYSNASRLGQIIGYVAFSQLAVALGYRGIFVLCSATCAVALAVMWAFRPQKIEVERPRHI